MPYHSCVGHVFIVINMTLELASDSVLFSIYFAILLISFYAINKVIALACVISNGILSFVV